MDARSTTYSVTLGKQLDFSESPHPYREDNDSPFLTNHPEVNEIRPLKGLHKALRKMHCNGQEGEGPGVKTDRTKSGVWPQF